MSLRPLPAASTGHRERGFPIPAAASQALRQAAPRERVATVKPRTCRQRLLHGSFRTDRVPVQKVGPVTRCRRASTATRLRLQAGRGHDAQPMHVTRDLCVYGRPMTRVTVITGGAGGMGQATAKIVGRDHAVVLADVRQDRLDAAATALNDLGITSTVVNCDVTDRQAVARCSTPQPVSERSPGDPHRGRQPQHGRRRLRDADQRGRHAERQRGLPGTAAEGAAIVNVASMAAHMLPDELIPAAQFPRP